MPELPEEPELPLLDILRTLFEEMSQIRIAVRLIDIFLDDLKRNLFGEEVGVVIDTGWE